VKVFNKTVLLAAASLFAVGLAASQSRADEIVKIGLSLPLSGSGAAWGKGGEWMCNQAAKEIKEAGGIKVKDKVYNVQCIAYDNKYTAAEGTKVAQTLLNRDGVKFFTGIGSAPLIAAQSMTERQNVMLFNTSWGKSSKGPNFPLSFTINNTPVEIVPALVKFLRATYPEAKTVAMLNVNDASGHETEQVANPAFEKGGFHVLTSDFYERGNTEFQAIAARLYSFHPDVVELSSLPMPDAGQVLKELELLGYKGVKSSMIGSSVQGISATGGAAANHTYMAAALTFDGSGTSEHQRKLNEAETAYTGEALSLPMISCYDAVMMMKAGIEAAQSVDPTEISKVLSTTKYATFYGGMSGFSGQEVYGNNHQPLLPVYITQIVDGKMVEKMKIDPRN
jgi:branched-chain amino acid transport system substrate-binding protein